MAELNDLSGPFNPHLKYEDLSKEFLLKLDRSWQWSWLQLDAAWYDEVQKRFGMQVASGCDVEMWQRCGDRCNTRYAKIARIPLTNVVDSLKLVQLPLDNATGAIYPTQVDVKNENHAVLTVTRCPSLEWCERSAPERIVPMCQVNEIQVNRSYFVNRHIQLSATKLPPRRGPDDIACQWELKLDAPAGARVRGKAEVVDETWDIPELEDLSGPLYPHLTHENFSKTFLIKMNCAYQYAWLVMNEGYYHAVRCRFGSAAADDCELAAWMRVAERLSRRYAKIGGIELRTVVDSLKLLQMAPDSTIGLFPASYEIRNPDHVVMTVTSGRIPGYLDGAKPERVPPTY
ncbi:MAG: DUF6125 family protein [Chloroflexi bacterium]|nr:DUF6125 family protein [Chloroflexota bacterium]